MSHRDPMEWERNALPALKKIWYKIKATKLFNKFRHSNLNPYHRGVMEIKADSLQEARQIARRQIIERIKHPETQKISKHKAQKRSSQSKGTDFIYNGVRYNVEQTCSVQEEFERDGVVLRGAGDVSDRIPRDKTGKLNLLAEEPIVMAIIPIEGPALIGHVCMQYQDVVVNRLLPSIHTDPLYPKYKNEARYYFVYPSQLGIDPHRLKREMEKHNIKYARKKYDLLTNNCAKNVADILKRVGVKDIDFYGWDDAGLVFTNPGNNPWGKGVKGWCLRHGVHVNLKEMEAYNEGHNFTDVKERRKEMDETHQRYEQYKKINRQMLWQKRQNSR